jgi:hypothetical protein
LRQSSLVFAPASALQHPDDLLFGESFAFIARCRVGELYSETVLFAGLTSELLNYHYVGITSTGSSTIMKAMGDIQIAGSLTTEDWNKFSPSLIPGGNPAIWERAFQDYFHTRLSLRYLVPIRVLQDNSTFQGEGFSIVAIQCSLIEFLESAVQGKSYRYRPRNAPPLEQHEYSSSSSIFVSFLINRTPFSADFTEDIAQEFYECVRCGLLHEARTKNGWTIWAKIAGSQTIDANRKIIYRDNFQTGLLAFVDWYKGRLPSDVALQEAFIRKFDSLCV